MSTETLNNDIMIATAIVKADGAVIGAELRNQMVFAEVEQNLYIPAMAILRFRNEKFASTAPTSFKIGAAVEISLGLSSNSTATVFSGEVVAQEWDFSPTGTPVVTVRAYDKSHRLMRGRKIRTFLNVKDTDVVSSIVGEAGLSVSSDATSTVYKYLIQNNETNYEFLLRRALRIGYEMFVDSGTSATTLKFRKPATTAAPATVTWGESLLDFKVRVTATKQVDKVTVRGWDPNTKKEIVGQATTATALQSITASADGGNAAKKAFGGSAEFQALYRYVFNQTEAQDIAQAVLNDVNSRYLQCQGRCMGNKDIKVGTSLKVKGVGPDYEGNYYITSATHRFDIEGYYTYFESNGKNTNTILEMTSQINQSGGGGMMAPVIGLVSNVKDAEGGMGRIKAKFPTLGDQIESDWMPVVTPMAGNGYGLQFMPEINDEILVAFANGDIADPYMVGAVWNAKDKPTLDTTSSDVIGGDGKILQRVIKTRSGHILTFNDSDDKPAFSVVDKTGNNKITIDSTSNTITIESDADIALKAAKGKVTIDAKEIDLTATENIKIKATQNIEVTATQNLTGKATQNVKFEATVNFEAKGTAAAKMEGAALDLKGTATGKLDGGGVMEVKGGVIKLN